MRYKIEPTGEIRPSCHYNPLAIKMHNNGLINYVWRSDVSIVFEKLIKAQNPYLDNSVVLVRHSNLANWSCVVTL